MHSGDPKLPSTGSHREAPLRLRSWAKNVRSSFDLRHPGKKVVPANALANQPPSRRGRYDLVLAKARFENSLQ